MMDREAVAERDAQERAQRIHAEHIVMDSQSPTFTCEMLLTPAMLDLARSLQASGKKRLAIREALAEHLIESVSTDRAMREEYLAYWQRAGVTAASSTLYDAGPPSRAWDDSLAELGRGNRLIQGLDGAMVVATSAAVVEQAHRDGRRAVMYNVQSPDPFGEEFDRIDLMHSFGLRVVQVTYNLRNRFGDGCLELRDGGLSRFGEALVEKLNRRHILMDLSHSSDQTALDVAAASKAPIACTHISARSISGHARSKPDAVLKEVARRGGYLGVLIVPHHILPPDGDGRAERVGCPPGWATVDTVVDHVIHLLNLVGSDCVGIGTDGGKPYYNALNWSAEMSREKTSGFDWVGWRPQDRRDPNKRTHGMDTWDLWPNLTAAMLRRGIPEETVVKVVGGNFLRIFREVCG